MATKKKASRSTKAATPRKKPLKKKAPPRSAAPTVDRETRRLEAIVEVFARSDLAQLEYEDQDICLKLSRNASPAANPGVVTSAPSPAPTVIASATVPGEPPPAPAAPETHLVKSPFVGTFYRAPSPEAPPFTEVGQRVSKGQTVCIIEAMKLMNEIPSDADGRIVAVLAENGEPVQFGDPLFEIAVK